MYVQCNNGALSFSHCCCGEAISVTYSECVSVALVIRDAMRMRRIMLLPVVCLALQYVSKLFRKPHDFLLKKLLNTKYVF
jgi:hypothetical protein